MEKLSGEWSDKMTRTAEFANTDEIDVYDANKGIKIHKNKFSDEFMDYLKNINSKYCSSIGYLRLVSMNLVRDADGTIVPSSFVNTALTGK